MTYKLVGYCVKCGRKPFVSCGLPNQFIDLAMLAFSIQFLITAFVSQWNQQWKFIVYLF